MVSAVPAANPVHSPSMGKNPEQDNWIDEVLRRLGEKSAKSKGNEAGLEKRCLSFKKRGTSQVHSRFIPVSCHESTFTTAYRAKRPMSAQQTQYMICSNSFVPSLHVIPGLSHFGWAAGRVVE